MSGQQMKRLIRADGITALILEKRNIQAENAELNRLSESLQEEFMNKMKAITNQFKMNLEKEAALDENIDKLLMGVNINEIV